ncbi:MAG TPA: helix-turn-helix domain-containing protein [Phycicoccus sp.]|nr:helix-turn-helix domain-containing protein [Phycicoccus sp.]
MSTTQEQAKALGDPTRHAIFRYVLEADEPIGVAELTDRVGLNHNAVRQHLTKLVAADLVVEGRAASRGPGRPRLLYTVDPSVESRWGPAGPYERLAAMLAETIQEGTTPVEIGRRAGRREASEHSAGDWPVAALAQVMARNGFEPTIEGGRGTTDIVLTSCPFASAALSAPDVICELHRGVALGAAEQVGGIEVVDLVRHDPRQARCRLQLRLEADGPTEPEAQV